MIRWARLPPIRFHDLRHGFATELLRAGVHPKIVSEALGHASVAFTLDVYSHVIPSMREAAATAIQQALGRELAE
jgi:integrase